MAPCEFSTSPTNPLRGSCVSERSRCGAVRISKLATNPLRGSCVSERSRCGAVRTFYVADEPSAGTCVSERSWRRANSLRGRRTLCGDRACRSALARRRGSCVSERSRCGAVLIFYVADEPSAGIVRVGSLSLWRRANFLRRRPELRERTSRPTFLLILSGRRCGSALRILFFVLNFHKATARAIRHARSPQRVRRRLCATKVCRGQCLGQRLIYF